MKLGRNINEEINESINYSNDSVHKVMIDSVYYSTTYDVQKPIQGLVIRPVLTSIRPINNKWN